MTKTQLPLYTILKMSVPQEMYIAVIPSSKNLSPNIHGYHYMGFIFGIDSAESSYLRKYVNRILEKGIKEWKRIDLSAKVEVVKPEVEEPLLEREEDKKEEGRSTASKEAETGFRVKSKNKLAKL